MKPQDFFPKVVKSLCVSLLSVQHSCWGIMHPSPQLWAEAWAWRGHGGSTAPSQSGAWGMSPACFWGRQLCPPWPQVVRLLSCSRDPTASLTDCRKVSFHLGVPWGHLNLAGRKLFPAWLCVRSLPGHLAKQG